MLYPLTFHPIFKERVWGGRELERRYGKPLPPGKIIGESWEISDRLGDSSVVANGPLAGKDLRWLMETRGEELLGSAKSMDGRFPLLIKILDAQETLSLQVHPPAAVAKTLGGEPKAEFWYITGATGEAELYVGLKRGVTRQEFERRTADGTVAGCLHRIIVRSGDAMFLPSGRVHAIGAGIVLFEIQQNSDTTYRVFDWNRLGLDGRPRELNVAESLAAIDFTDIEPSLASNEFSTHDGIRRMRLAEDELFRVDLVELERGERLSVERSGAVIIGVIHGEVSVRHRETPTGLANGQFCLIPAHLKHAFLSAESAVRLLAVEPG